MNRSFFLTCCILIIIPLSVITGTSTAHCADLKVPSQYPSIGKALSAASSGDTVKVAGGVYYEHITLKKGVVLQGGWNSNFSKRDVKANETIIDGIKEKGATVIGADKAVIDGFTIIHATLLTKKDSQDDKSQGSGIYCVGTSPKIINNVIRNNEPSGVMCSRKSKAEIFNNRIHDNAQSGVFVQEGADVLIVGNEMWGNKYSGIGSEKEPFSHLVARNNIIHDNDRAGISASFATGLIENNIVYNNKRAGINAAHEPTLIINNTVVGNGWAGISVDNPDSVITIKNNIVAYNKEAGIRTAGKGFSYNLLFSNNNTGDCSIDYLWCVRGQYGGYGDETTFKDHNGIIADPLFADYANHDYHLKGQSPAIDAGDIETTYNDVNFPSSLGSERNDMGAYGGPHALAEKPKANHEPVAIAGPDQVVLQGKSAILDGKDSNDPDGDPLSYKWQLVSSPPDSKGQLARADRDRAAVRVDKPGEYVVQLVVTDKHGRASKPDVIKISSPANRPPRANIGEIISGVSRGDMITLYGSSSKDPEGAPLKYKWSILFRPPSSRAVITDPGLVNSSFTVDADGGYTVQLIVNDGKLDSKPATVNINTRRPVKEGVRNVPGEYPTIQAAIDAAQPGDTIIVQKGIYNELLVVDKSVNLKGIDWPVLDGGNQSGNKNVISIAYLGDRAGSIEGFEIKGSGRGPLGHGISIWDSSPNIFNNRIIKNVHGIGVHGSSSLTSKTRIHANLIYDNTVGIGNGLASEAQIYNNRVYNNHVVGIGSRGKATPRIKANFIYNNRIGIGAREVASPSVESNRIFNNADGISIAPLSAIKRFSFNDIVIHNNLIANNDNLGIIITSFNLSNVSITNNTIVGNNTADRRSRAGGIVLGYPQPGEFKAVVNNNIISNNNGGGIVRFLGHENYLKPGATLLNDNNNLWQNEADFIGTKAGSGSKTVDPGFSSTAIESEDGFSSGLAAGYKSEPSDFSELPTEM